MSRFSAQAALILWTRRSGESNRDAHVLCEETGVLRATLYGGPKSRLRASVSPFHSGTLYLYHDPVRDAYKVSDFDVLRWRPGLRERYERAACAGAVAETILAGHGGGGNWREALVLANAVLDALDGADAEKSELLFTFFLWKWAEILGARPETGAGVPVAYRAALAELAVFDGCPPDSLPAALPAGVLNAAKNCCMDILASAFGRRLSSWTW